MSQAVVFALDFLRFQGYNTHALRELLQMHEESKTTKMATAGKVRATSGEASAWQKLTVKYLDDLPRQIEGIFNILEVKDYGKIKSQAHRIKGTSGTYKLETISRSAAELERAAASEDAEKIASALKDVKRVIDMENTRLKLQAITPDAG